MKYISITGTLICLLILSASSLDIKKEKKQTECLALALQGGGDMGAFQIGAFKGFVDRLRPEQVRYDVITGVSVGSINAGAIALHKIGNETGAAEYLNQMWRSFGPQNIYTSWDYGWVEGLTMRPGLFDNSVEIDYLTQKFKELSPDGKLYRKIMVNAVNSNDASIWTFNESLPYQDLPKAIVASTSMPFAFPHMRFQGKEFIDGGSVWNIDFSTAVQRCEEIVGKDHSRITVDIILCSGKHKHVHKETEKWSTREIKQRLEELKSFYSTMNDVVEVKRAYPSVNFRYLVFPTEELPTFFIPLVFEKESMEKMIDIGLEDARKVIEHGPGANFEALTKMNDALYQKAKYLNYEDVIKEVLSEREALAKKMTE